MRTAGGRCATTTTSAAWCSPVRASARSAPVSTAWRRWASIPRPDKEQTFPEDAVDVRRPRRRDRTEVAHSEKPEQRRNGIACGGGFYMLGEVEFIIAADHATFFDPHVTYGMTPVFEPIHVMQKMPFHEMHLPLLGNHETRSAHEMVFSEVAGRAARTQWAAQRRDASVLSDAGSSIVASEWGPT